MIEAPQPEHLTARRLPELDTIELIDWVPGPAGVAVADLADDEIRVLVDYARPAQFCSLEHSVGHPGALLLYDALTDGTGADVAAAVDLLDAQPRLVWQGPRSLRSGRNHARADADAPGSPLLRSIADLAISRSDLISVVHSPSAEVILRLHCIACEVALPRELRSSPGAAAELPSALDALEELLEVGALGSLTSSDRDSLIADLATCERAAAGSDLASHRIERLTRRLRSLADRPGSAASRLAPPLPAVRAGVLAEARVDYEESATSAEPPLEVDVRLVGIDGADVLRAAIDGPELRVSISTDNGDASRCWLRVFQRRGPGPAHDRHPSLIALAPFEPNEFGSAVALALLPATSPATDLVAEVTTRPTDAWSDDTALLIKQAVGFGQMAARHERAGADEEAAEHWTTCSHRWAAAGDDRRSNLARIFASGADYPNRSLPRSSPQPIGRLRKRPVDRRGSPGQQGPIGP